MKHLLVLVSVMSVAVGCRSSDNCNPTSTRCTGNVAEICDADHNWKPQLDCDDATRRTGSPFVCCYISEQTEDGLAEGHTCLPPELAGQAGGGS